MDLIFEPVAPWHWAATFLAALAVALYTAGTIRRHRTQSSVKKAALILLLTALAALCYVGAAWNPSLVEPPGSDSLHLSVVIDVSDSIQRAPEGWQAAHETGRDFLGALLESLPQPLIENSDATIITFGENTRSQSVEQLDELLSAYIRLDNDSFPVTTGSDLAGALDAGREAVMDSGHRGALLLISDGNQTTPGVQKALARLVRQEIPVFVLPVESGGPSIAIASVNLGRHLEAKQETFLRGIIVDNRPEAASAELTVTQNPGLNGNEGRAGPERSVSKNFTLRGNGLGHFRQSIRFEGLGVQFVDLDLVETDETGRVPFRHQRRLFTHVTRPPQFLSIGGDHRWHGAFPDDAAGVIEITPEQFTGSYLWNLDAVVISDVTATRFPPGGLAMIAEAVKEQGMGLMVINGDHAGGDEESETVLMSYTDTPIDPLLPVSSRPRPFSPEPPHRNLVIVIDASGSMAGWKLTMSKDIARYLITTFLRPQDRLDLLAFTTGASHLVENVPMDDQGKEIAFAALARIRPGGGTNPKSVLAAIADRNLVNCGLVFMSDGGFEPVTYRPDCRATVFGIGKTSFDPSGSLSAIADPFPVPEGFSPQSIRIPYFDPEPRKNRFEPGSYMPASMGSYLSPDRRLPVPPLNLEGNAITYVRDGADLIAVRPKLTDPVLAYREAEAGYVGVLTTAISEQWLDDPAGRKAVEAWMTRLLPYIARDRYEFVLLDRGHGIDIQISVSGDARGIPLVDGLTAVLKLDGGTSEGIRLRPVEGSPATFSGQLRPPRSSETQTAALVLTEWGQEALARPQRIPILIPPESGPAIVFAAEDYSYGMNESLLFHIAESSGGQFSPPLGTSIFRERVTSQNRELFWPWLILAGTLLYVSAIALYRLVPERG